MQEKKKQGGKQTVSRRRFIGGSIAAGAATVMSGSALPATASKKGAVLWDAEVDVVVVGGGAAAATAAVAAAQAGSSVLLIEKAPIFGGTSAKSDGGIWIPNNRFMREKGIKDPRDQALLYMARAGFPTRYRADDPFLGLTKLEHSLLATFYDNGTEVMDHLDKIGALKTGLFFNFPDYLAHLPENAAPRCRAIFSQRPNGQFGLGAELMRQLKSWLEAKNVPIRLKHRVRTLLRNDANEIAGVVAYDAAGKALTVRARKAVIFGTGGYTHNVELMRTFQPAPSYGGCAMPASEGDFLSISQNIGAKLGNMTGAWRAQVVLEKALQIASVPRDVWQPPGDSMIIVNKYGERVFNEKRDYHNRTRVHFVYDANRGEYPNQFLFMVYDKRTADLFGGNDPLPLPGAVVDYVISGATLADLGQAIQARLDHHASRIGVVRLADQFTNRIEKTVMTFNGYATAGKDEQFQRGEFPYDLEWHAMYMSVPRKDSTWKSSTNSNFVMAPFQETGPYYAIILSAGTLDTNGGPAINTSAQVLDTEGRPIPGLYGAGNCIASPAGEGYWGGGTTLGLAITFGHIAGANAVREEVKAAPQQLHLRSTTA